MKIYLFLLLVGFALSATNCIQYNVGRVREEKIGNRCPCPHGTKQSLPPGTEKCYCYFQSQIEDCQADKRCDFDIDMGCYKK